MYHCFSRYCQDYFFIFGLLQFNCYVFTHGFLWVYPNWDSVNFFIYKFTSFIHLGSFQPLFLQIFLLPQSLSSFWTYLLDLLILSNKTLRLCSVLFLLLIYSSNQLSSNDLSSTSGSFFSYFAIESIQDILYFRYDKKDTRLFQI